MCVIIVCVLFLLVGLWCPSFQQQTRAVFFRVLDSRLCVRLERECIMWEVYKLSVLFRLAGLWWSFLCAVCYYCLCFISLSRFVMALLPTTDSRCFLPRSWLAFVCKIGDGMHYVSMFINWLCFISLSRFVMAPLPTTDSRRFLRVRD